MPLDVGAFGVVYIVTHLASGRVYVGQTKQSVRARWAQHCSQPHCARLHRAIKKYGPDAFSVGVVAQADAQDSLDAAEVFFIEQMRATDRDKGFNLMTAARGGRHTAESRNKMSQALTAAWDDPEKRARWSASRRRPCRLDVAAKIAASNTGKRHTEETKALLSERRKEMWRDPQIREAMTSKQTARKRSPEARAEAAEKAKAQWADPERRRKGLEALAAARAKRHSNT